MYQKYVYNLYLDKVQWGRQCLPCYQNLIYPAPTSGIRL